MGIKIIFKDDKNISQKEIKKFIFIHRKLIQKIYDEDPGNKLWPQGFASCLKNMAQEFCPEIPLSFFDLDLKLNLIMDEYNDQWDIEKAGPPPLNLPNIDPLTGIK